MITKLELDGNDIKNGVVVGFIGSHGKFYNVQIKLPNGQLIELVPEKSGVKGAIIQTIKTNF